MAFVRMLAKLLRDKEIGEFVVPIVPDEARTFGMEALFRQVGIYSHVGQLYEPVDMDMLLYYKEAKEGQILEEGITEAGSMSSFIAAGSAYATHGINTIPFFIYYSMFGMQRVGDLVWAAADTRTRGFLLGGTAGRTTLAGEGLQHQDGHSHLLVAGGAESDVVRPGVRLRDRGDHRGRHPPDVQERREHLLLHHRDERESTRCRRCRRASREGILKGMYRFRASRQKKAKARAQLLGSGAILNEVRQGAADSRREVQRLGRRVERDELQELYRDGHAAERWNRLHPGEKPRVPYVTQCLGGTEGCSSRRRTT